MEWFSYYFEVPKTNIQQISMTSLEHISTASPRFPIKNDTENYIDVQIDKFVQNKEQSELHFLLHLVIRSSTFLSSIQITPEKYYKLKLPINPFQQYMHEYKDFQKVDVYSSLLVLFPYYRVFKQKQLRVLEIMSQIQHSNSYYLRVYRENNLNIRLDDVYNCIEVEYDNPRVTNVYLLEQFNYLLVKEDEVNKLKFKYKHDVIFYNNTFFKYETRKESEFYNLNLLITFLFKLDHFINNRGFLFINIRKSRSLLFVDVLQLLSFIFKNVTIIKTALHSSISHYKVIVCEEFDITNFNNIILSQNLKLNQIGSLFKIHSQTITNIAIDVLKFDNKLSNDEHYKLNYIYNKYKNNEPIKDDIINLQNDNKLFYINLYKYLNFNIPLYVFYNKLDTLIYNSAIQIQYYLKYQRKEDIQLINISDIDTNYLNYIEKDLFNYKKYLDTIDSVKFNEISTLIQISGTLKYKLSQMLQIKLSQAFCKMSEIIIDCNILFNKKEINSFHICEAPGQFIQAYKYYCNKLNIKYTWMANSLNHLNKQNINKYGPNILADAYYLIKNNPKNWLYGADNTGDITVFENILAFTKNKYDLITADCGLQIETYGYQEDQLGFINYCQCMIILLGLNTGGTAIFKLFLPLIRPSNISLLYIFYKSFQEMIYFKPTINPSSSEIYVVCKGFIELKDSEILINGYKTFNIDKYLFDQIDNTFIQNHITGINKCIHNNKISLFRTINLFYYINQIDKSLLDTEKDTFNTKWINKYIK